MAALVLGRLLTRPDTAPALRQVVDWAAATLASCPEEQAPFLVPGAFSLALMYLVSGADNRRGSPWPISQGR